MQSRTADQGSVQFSRTQGVNSAIALGGSVVLGATLFVAAGEILQQCGDTTPLAFAMGAILFLPLIVSCLQRSSGNLAQPSFYGAAQASGSSLRLFFAAWLMFGGYLCLGALLLHGAAWRANMGLAQLLGFTPGLTVIVAILVAAAFFKELFSKVESWGMRTVLFWCSTLFLVILIAWVSTHHFRSGGKIPTREPLQHWLLAVSLLASSLWGIEVVLNYRNQFRFANATTGWSLIAIFCGAGVIGALTSVVVLHDPSLYVKNWSASLSWHESRLEFLILLCGFLICFSALLRVMTRMWRLLASMMIDGVLPLSDSHRPAGRNLLVLCAGLSCASIALLAVFCSTSYLLLVSAFAALVSLLLFLQPLLRKDISRVAALRLPLHPLIPVSAVVIAVFLLWILPIQDLFTGGAWLIAGAILYWFGARKRMVPAMQQQQVLSAEDVKPAGTGYRVVVCLGADEWNESLLRLGASIAASRGGEVMVLRILETSELLPTMLQRAGGEQEWARMQESLQRMRLPGQPPVPVVRMAPELVSGIKATLREYSADFVLLPWPAEKAARLRKNHLQSLLQITAKPLGILKGEIGEKPLAKISVACGSSDHSALALQIADALGSADRAAVEVVRVFTKSESHDAAHEAVERMVRKTGIRPSAEVVVVQESAVGQGILRQSAGSQVLLIGASDDPLSGRPLPDGHSIDVAMQRKEATLIVKGKEESGKFLLRRALSEVTNRVSALTPKERSELLGNLKVGLQAGADFYLMVALAAAIAITGLIMNDGSIVLGAMLVSPLMSPIVGIACGIALGNVDLMRRSGASTFKGMTLVLGVAVVMAFLLPAVQPTDQILSRTRPGIFDLLAALAAGAAGAYSLGRKTVAGALPGVAMSLSLEPPLAAAGYGLSTSQFWIASGAFLLFLTNLAAIVLSGAGVYLMLGMRPPRKEGMGIVARAVFAVVLATLVLVVPLGFGTYGVLQRGHMKYQVEKLFRTEALRERFQLLDLNISETDSGFVIQPTVMAGEEVGPQQIEKFRKVVEAKVGVPIRIEANLLQTKRIESPANTQGEKETP